MVFIAMLAVSVLWSTEPFYQDLNQAQRYDLSQAYLSVSEHFQESGDEDRAQAYRIVADEILASIAEAPRGETETVVEDDQTMEEPQVEATAVDERTQRAILYYFNKLGSSIAAGRSDRALDQMAFPFQAGSYDFSEEEIAGSLEILVSEYEISGYTIDMVWMMDTATFRYEGEGVVLSLVTAVEDPGIFIFWKDPQDFLFVQEDSGWKLKAIN